jgi:hypothetical protein
LFLSSLGPLGPARSGFAGGSSAFDAPGFQPRDETAVLKTEAAGNYELFVIFLPTTGKAGSGRATGNGMAFDEISF